MTTDEIIEAEIMSEEEFRESTMGCFYQDELRLHDKKQREKIAFLRKALESKDKQMADTLEKQKEEILEGVEKAFKPKSVKGERYLGYTDCMVDVESYIKSIK